MKLKTYVINLKASSDRRQYMEELTAYFPFMDVEWVEAVDGRALSLEEKESLFDKRHFQDRYHGRIPLPGEIGCTLSHRACYRKLLDSKDDMVLILEDDVTFLHFETLEAFYKAATGLIHSGTADMVISVSRSLSRKKGRKTIDGYTFEPVYTAYTTCACLVGRNAARKILEGDAKPSIVADDFSGLRRMGVTVYEGFPVMTCGLSDGDRNGMSSTINFRETYERVPRTFRYLKYRLLARCAYYKIMLGIAFGRYTDARGPHLFLATPLTYINKANGL